MRAAVVENGVVTNIIVIDPDKYQGQAVITGELPVAIGDAYDGTGFVRGGKAVMKPAEYDSERIEALRLLGVESTGDVLTQAKALRQKLGKAMEAALNS